MATVLRHPHTTRGTRVRRDATTVMRWPRGLALIGLCALLLSAWGGIVPYVGPVFGYSSNGAPAWDWTLQHALLYLAPGAVGVLFSLGVLSRAGGGRGLARASLGFSGLVLIACGAWFVIGPVTWPIWHPAAAVFGHATSPTTHFLNEIGYNLGVGVLLAALGGMVMKAVTGEREIVAATATSTAATDVGYAGERYAGDRTMADPAYTDRTVGGAGEPVTTSDRTMAGGEPVTREGRTVAGAGEPVATSDRTMAGEPPVGGVGTPRAVEGGATGAPADAGTAYPAGSTAGDSATGAGPMSADPAGGSYTAGGVAGAPAEPAPTESAPAESAPADETRQL
ncbi:MAG TPA: hypothetical protein VKU91_03940 [Acidimicrobiales bacterium]|nr:hypothetical protein [Acidimicrobiales bacterium]